MFAVEPDGSVEPLTWVPSGGVGPRYFRLVEARRRLLVANEKSGTVVPFRLDADGRPTPCGRPAAAPGVTYIGLAG